MKDYSADIYIEIDSDIVRVMCFVCVRYVGHWVGVPLVLINWMVFMISDFLCYQGNVISYILGSIVQYLALELEKCFLSHSTHISTLWKQWMMVCFL